MGWSVFCATPRALISDGTRHPISGYLDDFIFLATSQEHLQALLHALERFCQAVRMELCVPKSKVLVFLKGARVPCQLTRNTVSWNRLMNLNTVASFLDLTQACTWHLSSLLAQCGVPGPSFNNGTRI